MLLQNRIEIQINVNKQEKKLGNGISGGRRVESYLINQMVWLL